MPDPRSEIVHGVESIVNGLYVGLLQFNDYDYVDALMRGAALYVAYRLVFRAIEGLYLCFQRFRHSYWSGIHSFNDRPRHGNSVVDTTPCSRLKFGEFRIDNGGRILQEVISVDTNTVLGLVDVTDRTQLITQELAVLAKVHAKAPRALPTSMSNVQPEMAIQGSHPTVSYTYRVRRDEVRFYASDADGTATLQGYGVRVGWSTPDGPVSLLATCHHVLASSSHIRGYTSAPYALIDASVRACLGDLVLLDLPRDVWAMLGVEQSNLARLYHDEVIYMAEEVPVGTLASLVKSKSVRLTKGLVKSPRSDELHVFGFNHSISTDFGHSGRAIRNRHGQPVAIHCARDSEIGLNVAVALFRSIESVLSPPGLIPPPPSIGESGDPVHNEMWITTEATLPDRLRRRIGKREYQLDAARGVFRIFAEDPDDPTLWANMVDSDERVMPENATGCVSANVSHPIQPDKSGFQKGPLPKGGPANCPLVPSQPAPPPPITKTSVSNVLEGRGKAPKKPKSLSQDLKQPTRLLALDPSQVTDLGELRKHSSHLQRYIALLEKKSGTSHGQENSPQRK